MIERKFIRENMLEYEIKEFIQGELKRAGLSDVKFQRTPLGEKIVIYAHRPGLVVGRGGSNIAELTQKIKKNFNMENPQVEIEEVTNPDLDPNIIAEMIANNLERFGPTRFKGIGYRALNNAIEAGARGVEILITGRVPSARARKWRFYAGYLKKSGETALTSVKKGFNLAVIKAGSVGIKVSLMTPDTKLPDDITIHEATVEDATDEETEKEVEEVEKEAEKSGKKTKKSDKKKSDSESSKKKEQTADSKAASKEDSGDQSKDNEDSSGSKASSDEKEVKKPKKKEDETGEEE